MDANGQIDNILIDNITGFMSISQEDRIIFNLIVKQQHSIISNITKYSIINSNIAMSDIRNSNIVMLKNISLSIRSEFVTGVEL